MHPISAVISCLQDAWARQFQQQQRAAPVRSEHTHATNCFARRHIDAFIVTLTSLNIMVVARGHGSGLGIPAPPECNGGGLAHEAATTPGATPDGVEGSATTRMGSGDEVGNWLRCVLYYDGLSMLMTGFLCWPDDHLFDCMPDCKTSHALTDLFVPCTKIMMCAALRQLQPGAQSPHHSKTFEPKRHLAR